MSADDLVVPGKLRAVRDLVVGRRRDKDESRRRGSGFNRIKELVVTGFVDIKIFRIEGHVVAVVHAEHNRDDGGLMRKQVALETRWHVAGIAAVDVISRNARIPELDVK